MREIEKKMYCVPILNVDDAVENTVQDSLKKTIPKPSVGLSKKTQ
jgi:hypothetical protein